MTRQYRHLKMLKRAGRGHDASGTLGTRPGDLAVVCPACPHPGVNLPQNWTEVHKDNQCILPKVSINLLDRSRKHFRYLFQQILAVDANFRLKNRLHTRSDIGFGTGLAYFVEPEPYHAYLLSHGTEVSVCFTTSLSSRTDDGERCTIQTSTCSGLRAVDHANTRGTKRLRATGVGASTCARHGFLLPLGLGDLQRGERSVTCLLQG